MAFPYRQKLRISSRARRAIPITAIESGDRPVFD